MKATLERNDRQFLQQMHRLEPVTVQQLCDTLSVTATAVRQRLARLQILEFVSRHGVRSGRGRPHFVYRITESGRKLLGENCSDLALILWQAIRGIEEPHIREQIENRVCDFMAERYGRDVVAGTIRDRVGQLGTALNELGFDVETDHSGQFPILRENNCPYPELADCDPTICELEQHVFERVLGTQVTLTQCCRDGYHCCEFQAGNAAS